MCYSDLEKLGRNIEQMISNYDISTMGAYKKQHEACVKQKELFRKGISSLKKDKKTISKRLNDLAQKKENWNETWRKISEKLNQQVKLTDEALEKTQSDIKSLKNELNRLKNEEKLQKEKKRDLSSEKDKLKEKSYSELAQLEQQTKHYENELEKCNRWLCNVKVSNHNNNNNNNNNNSNNVERQSLKSQFEAQMQRLDDLIKESFSKLMKQYKDWDQNDTSEFLRYAITQTCEKGKEKNYVKCICSLPGINGSHLPKLNESLLEMIGIDNVTDRMRIVAFVQRSLGAEMNDNDMDEIKEDFDIDNNSGNGSKCGNCCVRKKTIAYPCGHVYFCQACYNKWKQEKQELSCPFCRKSGNAFKLYHTVY